MFLYKKFGEVIFSYSSLNEQRFSDGQEGKVATKKNWCAIEMDMVSHSTKVFISFIC